MCVEFETFSSLRFNRRSILYKNSWTSILYGEIIKIEILMNDVSILLF